MKRIKALLFIFATLCILSACKKTDSAPSVSGGPRSLGVAGSIITIDTLRSAIADTAVVIGNYKITGIVISNAAAHNLTKGYVVIQNHARGITLALDSSTAASFSTGDSLVVDITGASLVKVKGTTLLKGLTAAKITTAGTGKTVAPVVIALDKLSAAFGLYEATLVKVVTTSIYPTPAPTDTYLGDKFLSDASGQSTVRLHTDTAAIFASTLVPSIATFVAIPTFYDSAANTSAWADKQLRIQNMDSVKAVSIVAAWQFGAPASVGNEATYTATTTEQDLIPAVLSRGPGLGITGSTLARGYTSNAAVTLPTKDVAIAQGSYFQFTVTAKNPVTMSFQSLVARLRRSASGANVYRWRYSIDGTNFFDLGPADVSFTSTDDGVDQAPIDLSGVTALQNVPQGTSVIFRLYGWGFGNIGSGTFAVGRYAAGVTSNSLTVTALVQ